MCSFMPGNSLRHVEAGDVGCGRSIAHGIGGNPLVDFFVGFLDVDGRDTVGELFNVKVVVPIIIIPYRPPADHRAFAASHSLWPRRIASTARVVL
jgi:hypothetical protein